MRKSEIKIRKYKNKEFSKLMSVIVKKNVFFVMHGMVHASVYGCRNGAEFNILKFYSCSTFIHIHHLFIFIQHLFIHIQHLFIHIQHLFIHIQHLFIHIRHLFHLHSTLVCIQY